MPIFPPSVDTGLSGWDLFWVEMEITGDVEALDDERRSLGGRLSVILKGLPVALHPTVQSVRSLFRNAGCDPTRHRPSSEALLRRLARGEELPAILPAVDINNIWSVELLVPCCVIDPETLSGKITLRRGQPGEIMASMRGPFHLEGKPVLADDSGPFGTPITDSERVKVSSPRGTFWLVAYLPRGVVNPDYAQGKLNELVGRMANVRILSTS